MGGARKGPAQVIFAGAAADGDGVVGRLRLTDLTTMRGRGGESFSKSPGGLCMGDPGWPGWPTLCWTRPAVCPLLTDGLRVC